MRIKAKGKRQKAKVYFKRQNFYFLLVLLPFYFLLLPLCHAQPVSSTDLIKNAKQLDGKTVTYEGEIIGEIMLRGEYAWLNVNDGEGAIGIWLGRNLLKGISYTGSYKYKGDVIEVMGIFNRACPQHGGDLDIHGQAVREVASGREVLERFNYNKIILAIILLGVFLLIWISSLLKRK